MDLSSLLFLLQLLSHSNTQQPGKTPENPASFIITDCGNGSKCKEVSGGLTIDANWRATYVMNQDQKNYCNDGGSWTSVCSGSGEECAKTCMIDGTENYAETYGVSSTAKGSITMRFLTRSVKGQNIGSRLYFLESSGDKYHMFKLKNRQFEFDVDVSKLPCGVKGALYFTSMEQDGGKSKHPSNAAGAKYGTGYCDAKCPKDIKWVEGQANIKGWKADGEGSGKGDMGVCCPEMDVWEANSFAQAFTSHTCNPLTSKVCTGDQCGDTSANRYNGFCDKDGCDFASYRFGAQDFYGQGKKLDTSKKFTVITQFITQGNTNKGELIEVRRMYLRQDGTLIQNEPVKVQGLDKKADSLTDKFCQANKDITKDQNSFKEHGGMKAMGQAMKNGMVLVMSIMDDKEDKMQWLDGIYPPNGSADKYGVKRGPCDPNSGDRQNILTGNPAAEVVFSNVKIGPIKNPTTANKPTGIKQKRSTYHI
ncbi:uncharacterized protein PGTG_06688 [Puccinia graminis f. sp. tritici CRL 75-36-700-3]|uniref:Glucanase n=2 Tax=Puccinia graminis f. sp. tritici TaxID=56615 RepID=E3K8C2_PUCGT|nr:uncharacterized protein PGTG_06688 [Puccinia graminis f. sp. tritici CRL 75-36-700-3]EFP80732.1 hypothetical protein PGTG_06688 [Puccinia graminis f. sp. tritici CRL 75-36-700-3]